MSYFFVYLQLVATAAASTLERNHPPHHGHDHGQDHGHGHEHPAVVPENPDDLSNPNEPVLDTEAEISEESVVDPELEIIEGSVDEEITVERKLHRQRRHPPHNHDLEHEHNHEHGHGHGHPEPIPEEAVNSMQEDEDEVEDLEYVAIQKRQENTEEEENTTLERQEIAEETQENEDEVSANLKQWVTCDYATTPLFSCYDCNSRLRCKSPIGGRVIPCYSPVKPYCNNGICSSVPSALCTSNSSPRV